jgi:predicted MFS family arabinose efflux permease
VPAAKIIKLLFFLFFFSNTGEIMAMSNRVTLWSMWFIVSFFYAYQYILRVIPSIMIEDIMNRFTIDAALFGQFSGVYYLGYSLMHIPLGIMLDRKGPKKILPIFILLTIVGTLPLVLTHFWVYPIIGRFFIGMGSSAAILGVFKIVRMSFAEHRFAMMLSWSVTIGLLGAIYGGAPINYLRDNYGYNFVLWTLIAVGISCALISYIIIPEYKEESLRGSLYEDIKNIIFNKRVLAICFAAGFMVGPLEGFADVWGVSFLQTVYGLDKSVAATLTSLMYVGMAVGGPLLTYIGGRLNNYILVILWSAILMATAFVLLLQGKLAVALLGALFFTVGILCAYQILAIYVASTYVPQRLAGLMSAVANMIIMTFGYAFHATMGAVIDNFAGHEGFVPLDSVSALSKGIWVVPIGLFIGIIIFIGLIVSPKRA